MSVKYEVGKPYPNHRRNTGAEGACVTFYEVGFDVLVVLNGISKDEINSFKTGRFRYGLFIKNSIPFFLMEFGTLDCDCSFNIRKVVIEKIEPWLQADFNVVNFILIEQRGFIVKALRAVGLKSDPLLKLKESLKDQFGKYNTAAEIDQQILLIMNQYTTKQMVKEIGGLISL